MARMMPRNRVIDDHELEVCFSEKQNSKNFTENKKVKDDFDEESNHETRNYSHQHQ